MRQYFEDLWERIPADAEPGGLELRRGFLLAHVEPGLRVLDLGCGAGELTAALAQAGAEVTGADVAEAALRRARAAHPQIDFRRVPIDGPLPFADNAFDAVWAGEVVERVADTGRWLSEVRRMLVPGGSLLLSTAYHGRVKNALLALAAREPHADPLGDRLRPYTAPRLRRLLAEFGFEAIELRPAGGAPLLRRTLLVSARRAPLGAWR